MDEFTNNFIVKNFEVEQVLNNKKKEWILNEKKSINMRFKLNC